MWNSSSSGPSVRRSPVPVTTSYSRQVSWKPPYRNDIDSTEQPATAPPSVMPSSSGTTLGTSPSASVRRTTWANVAPGSAVQVRASTSTSRTAFSDETSTARPVKRPSPGSGTKWWTPPLWMWTGSAPRGEVAHLGADRLDLLVVSARRGSVDRVHVRAGHLRSIAKRCAAEGAHQIRHAKLIG